MKQFLTYVNGGPFQHAIAVGLGLGDDYYAGFAAGMRDKRDRLCAGLADAGFDVFEPQGTYFVTTDIRSLGGDDGIAFCRVAAGAVRGGRGTERRVLRRQGRGRVATCGGRAASGPRCSTKPSPA